MATPALPPSSRATRLSEAAFLSCHPTAALPVKESIFSRLSTTSGEASSFLQIKTLRAPAGHPADRRISPKVSAVRGVWDAGLSTTGLPIAPAGESL